MKTHLLKKAVAKTAAVFAASVLLCSAGYAQVSLPWMTGGNSTSTGAFLGTTNSQPLIFKTSGQERGRFDVNGNLGIGVPGPLFKVHVDGDIFTTGKVYAKELIINQSMRVDTIRDIIDIQLVNGLCIGGTGQTEICAKTDNLMLQSDPGFNFNTFINANNSGRVGIGTTNPQAKLDVNGNAKISSLAAGSGYKLVGVDASGNLVPVAGDVQAGPNPGDLELADEDWHTYGNNITDQDFIGTLNNHDFVIKTNNSERGRVTTTGYMQVGNGAWRTVMGQADGSALNYGTGYLGFNASRDQYTGSWTIKTDGFNNGGGAIWGNVQGQMFFATVPRTSNANQTLTDANLVDNIKMTITEDGRVGIGTDNPNVNFKLSVKGSVICEEVQVDLYQNWPDYVFHEKYELMPLEKLEAFIQTNMHLPNIPSAKMMEERGGIGLGEMQTKQMEKTEELYLYIIQLHNDIEALKAKINELESRQ